MIKILTIVGARPQFVKSSVLSRTIKENYSNSIQEMVVHTGQHYDAEMSEVFFSELGINKPDITLTTGSGSHAEQTGKIMLRFESVLKNNSADFILVYVLDRTTMRQSGTKLFIDKNGRLNIEKRWVSQWQISLT